MACRMKRNVTNILQDVSAAHLTTSVYYGPREALYFKLHVVTLLLVMVVLYSAGVQLAIFKL